MKVNKKKYYQDSNQSISKILIITCFHCMLGLCISNYLLASLTNPGYIKKNIKQPDELL
jgi:hypothetical protein